MPLSVRSTICHALLILGAIVVILVIALMALQLPGSQLDWFTQARGTTPYFACWRVLQYTLILADWTAALRLRPALVDQQRVKRLGLIGFSSIILVELSRV